MECTNCKSQCKEHILGDLIISYCDNCWDFITNNHKQCVNHELVFVKFTNNGGTLHLKKQCFNCGQIETHYYSRSSVPNFNSLPYADMDASRKFDEVDYEKLSKICKRYDDKRKKFKKEKSFDKFLEEHTLYLKTDEWKKRRELVLKRDDYLCQSCLEKKATEVHHKSYRYWKNEPLFELVSVCDKCHKKITEMNREVMNFTKVIKE